MLGAPSTTADILGYQRFLFACASDPRFTGGNFLAAISQVTELSMVERFLYRFLLVPQTRSTLLQQKQDFAWTETRPDWGPGRIDPFNPVKVAILDTPVGDTIGNADMEPIWNLRPRVEGGLAFHWDGLNTDLTEVFITSALGDGATPKSLPFEDVQRLQDWAMDLQPPAFADYFPVDAALVAEGKPVYEAECARCHAFGGALTGQVMKLSDAAWEGGQTDPHRAAMWTSEAAERYNAYADRYPWDFSHFRSTDGYVSVPLDGIWLRAPYLHNGSVPYLDELLAPPGVRPKVFSRGLDVYDPVRMGFVSEGPEAERRGFRLDTREPGNSNTGHLWGIALAPEEKRALLEYLKTL
jgi:hypothetical protein